MAKKQDEPVFPGAGAFYKNKLTDEVVQVEYVENFHTVYYHTPGSSRQDVMDMELFSKTFDPTDDPNKEAADKAAKEAYPNEAEKVRDNDIIVNEPARG